MTAPLPAGAPAAPTQAWTGPLGGLAPTGRQLEAAKRNRTVALAVWMVPVALVMAGLYWRLAVGALPLGLGLISWVLPAAVAAVIAALLWALIVEPNSRGNALGDTHRAEAAIDGHAVAADATLLTRGKHMKEQGDLCAEAAHAELLEAEERITDALEVCHRALQVTAGVLNVPDVPAVRAGNLMKPTMPHIDRIRGTLDTELDVQRDLAAHLAVQHLQALEELPSPHLPLAEPADVPPGLDYVDPRGVPGFAGSTLSGGVAAGADADGPARPRRGRRVLLSVLAVALLIAAVVWLVIGHGASSLAAARAASPSAAATPAAPSAGAGSPSAGGVLVPAHPAVPAGLREGVDFAFLHHYAGGPGRWGCSSPITVRLAGPAPAGAGRTLVGAVAALRRASGLPLLVGAPLHRPIPDQSAVPAGEIVYNYLTPQEVAAAHLDLTGDVLGEGGPDYDDATGQITSGWVAIRADGVADPRTRIGEEVAWHEGAHALGLGHARQRSGHAEIMAPATDGSAPLAWGPGDAYALKAVGCARR